MPSPQFEKLIRIMWEQRPPDRPGPVEKMRANMEKIALPPGPDVVAQPVDAGGIPAEWVSADGSSADRAVLYLHGGGYVMGSLRTHRKLAGDLARASGSRVLLVDYRLAPECPLPGAVDDAVTAYRWLLDQMDPSAIAIGGDSAGGGLAVATLLAIRTAGLPQPTAAVLISPWTDLTLAGESHRSRVERDPVVTPGGLGRMAAMYVGDGDPAGEVASPARADLSGLAPMLIHVGDAEVLLDDSVLLAERGSAAGVDVTLEVWPDMVHVWHIFAGRVPEATDAVDGLGRFLRKRLGA